MTLNGTWNVPRNTKLCLNGHSVTANATASNQYSVITIISGAALTLCDCAAKSGVVTGGYAELGGGVFIDSGNFTMNGGIISQNTGWCGGGVDSFNGDIIMSGGVISRNTASKDSGGVELGGKSKATPHNTSLASALAALCGIALAFNIIAFEHLLTGFLALTSVYLYQQRKRCE